MLHILSFLPVVLYIFFASFGMLLMKKGGKNSFILFNKKELSINVTIVFFIGILFYILSFFLWIRILSVYSPIFISPIVYGITFVVISIFSKPILNEKVTKFEIYGAVVILIGVIVVLK